MNNPQPEKYDIFTCPFCGSSDVRLRDLTTRDDNPQYNVSCNTCEAMGPFVGHQADAIRFWNEAQYRERSGQFHWFRPSGKSMKELCPIMSKKHVR